MEVRTYRSIDRSVQFFGIRGRFLVPMGAGAVASLIVAFAVGGSVNGLVGLALFLILFFGCAAAVVALQGRISEKALARKLAMSRCPQYIHVRPLKIVSGWKSAQR